MPPLDEGSLLYMPVTLPNVSINEAKRLIQVQDAIIKSAARGGAGARQGGARRDLHRPGAGLHVREHHHPEAQGTVAPGHHQGRHRLGTGREAAADRRPQRLDPADHQPDQHALHRRAYRPRA